MLEVVEKELYANLFVGYMEESLQCLSKETEQPDGNIRRFIIAMSEDNTVGSDSPYWSFLNDHLEAFEQDITEHAQGIKDPVGFKQKNEWRIMTIQQTDVRTK